MNDYTNAEEIAVINKLMDKHSPRDGDLRKAGFKSPEEVRLALIRHGFINPKAQKPEQLTERDIKAQDRPKWLKTAYHLYKNKGYTVSQVAEQCDVCPDTIYRYFKIYYPNYKNK